MCESAALIPSRPMIRPDEAGENGVNGFGAVAKINEGLAGRCGRQLKVGWGNIELATHRPRRLQPNRARQALDSQQPTKSCIPTGITYRVRGVVPAASVSMACVP